MEEFVPKRKTKIFTKEFVAKYSYVLVLAVLLIGGISYGYTFFTENKKIASGSITTANLTINFSNREISASNLSVPANDQEGLSEFSKNLTITNQTATDGKVEIELTRTSGIELSNLRYASVVNGAIQEIDDVPADGEILSTAIMGNEQIDVEVMLWPKSTYSGTATTFVGELTPEISYLGTTATDTSNLTGKYVNFNCSSTCEVWQIVKVEDDRLVLTRQADYSGATSRTNSNRYNSSLTFNDDSLITSVSTDNKNVYLAKTAKINGGEGTQADPYTLINNEFREGDKKVIAVITYKHETTTVGTQKIYYNETNYISQVYNDPDFDSWTDGTNNYELGDVINISSDTNLTAVLVPKLSNRIMTLCNDSNVAYVKKYNTANGAPIDTPDGSGNEDVCYYTEYDSANSAGQNGNVIFGNYCWRIVRTTANGGVKLIYNGLKTNDDKCPSNINDKPTSLRLGINNTSTGTSLSSNKLYGTGFELIEENGTNKFRLKNTFTANWNGDYDNDGNIDYPKIIGNYVCGTTSSATGDTDTCTIIYYVSYYINSTSASTVSYKIISGKSYSVGGTSFNGYNNNSSMVSYMYNDVYNVKTKNDYDTSYDLISYFTSPSPYIYGDKATWNSNTNEYDLTIDDGNGNDITPTTTSSWSDIRSSVGGMYTCMSSSYSSCANVKYVLSNSSDSVMYYITLSNNENISTKGFSWTYSTSYSKSGNDYVLTSPTTETILYKDWHTHYNNQTYFGVYVCSDYTSSTCSELYYINRTNKRGYYYNQSSKDYIYGNSVRYENGHYIIDTYSDPEKYHQVWDWYKNYNTINKSHYTCFKTNTNDCDNKIYFVYHTSNTASKYIELTNGETIEIALDKMYNTTNSNSSTLNKYSSAIKSIVDNWYERNLLGLTSYIDANAVYCNDRSIKSLGSFDSNGSTEGSVDIVFSHNISPNFSNASLSCPMITDRFSVNNNVAKLMYPVGIITEDERALMTSSYAKVPNVEYWTMTPRNFTNSNEPRVYYVNTTGVYTENYITTQSSLSILPVITLKPGITITGGNGTYDTPYIIDINS